MAATHSRLLALPGELRNTIYELVFTSDNADGKVDVRDASPPPKALLLTCKQVYNETRRIHRDAHRKYWKETTFVLDLRSRFVPAVDPDKISRLKNCDLEHIANLEAFVDTSDSSAATVHERIKLSNTAGLWLWKSTYANDRNDSILPLYWTFYRYRDKDKVSLAAWSDEESARSERATVVRIPRKEVPLAEQILTMWRWGRPKYGGLPLIERA
ncbi:hypothetical protein CLAFUW4_11275 [Fulvia fulva]|uniref:uncharacterized protein n=1 Tax=Passalora fulva TaxID=5499 RepID=UPI0028524DFA|nr:uncharacterized protein CLAFUR5_20309 [Fulvia fulva]KAK4619601.1 hypothetical protein CLAFUR4_11281 [Fulvia fulva]KAK4620492.1 hypothetical protein CLAFUR0_11286 [Fulvia fulva]WMI38956.1 hypothetical protein CLAFUR5_20309 [Fulvia fulva]WPV17040.1 hypothetical protein CLAFUW4_11275 [Fulvia fulva]WPV32430.1 hypothetical protein CLAFUW7_11271 [Fulvia fulva]